MDSLLSLLTFVDGLPSLVDAEDPLSGRGFPLLPVMVECVDAELVEGRIVAGEAEIVEAPFAQREGDDSLLLVGVEKDVYVLGEPGLAGLLTPGLDKESLVLLGDVSGALRVEVPPVPPGFQLH